MCSLCGRVWAWLDPSAWCWELVSKYLRSKGPWCEITSHHWLKIKYLQENQPRQITTGPNLQKVTVVMPERPLTLVFRQGVLFFLAYCTHGSQVFVQTSPWFSSRHFPDVLRCCESLMHSSKTLALATSKAKIIWSHGCVLTCLEEVGPCKLSSINHRATGPSAAKLDYPAKPWACAPVLLMGFAGNGVASSSALPPWPDILLLNALECFSELLKAIFLLGNTISTKPCKSNATWRSTASTVLGRDRHFAHCPVPMEWVVCWLDSLAWSIANFWP